MPPRGRKAGRARSLRALARDLGSVGLQFIPTLDTRIRTGTILHRASWRDITAESHLTSDRAITGESLGPEGGPDALGLRDLDLQHDLAVGGALELVGGASPRAAAEFKRARRVRVTFDAPVSYWRDLDSMTDAVHADPGFFGRVTGRRLLLKRRFVAAQVVRARISLMFLGSGDQGASLDMGRLGDLAAARVSSQWRWRNEVTLESRRELVVAVELAAYHRRRHMFLTA